MINTLSRKLVGVFAIVALSAALYVGCVVPQQTKIQRQQHFIEQEYAPYRQKGTGRIVGQAFARTRGGDVKVAAGSLVVMNPVTSYSTEWFRYWVSGKMPMLGAPDPRILEFSRSTRADAGGNFEFSDLAEGEYYVCSSVFWEVPSRYGLDRTGDWLGSKVKVKNGEVTKAILAP